MPSNLFLPMYIRDINTPYHGQAKSDFLSLVSKRVNLCWYRKILFGLEVRKVLVRGLDFGVRGHRLFEAAYENLPRVVLLHEAQGSSTRLCRREPTKK